MRKEWKISKTPDSVITSSGVKEAATFTNFTGVTSNELSKAAVISPSSSLCSSPTPVYQDNQSPVVAKALSEEVSSGMDVSKATQKENFSTTAMTYFPTAEQQNLSEKFGSDCIMSMAQQVINDFSQDVSFGSVNDFAIEKTQIQPDMCISSWSSITSQGKSSSDHLFDPLIEYFDMVNDPLNEFADMNGRDLNLIYDTFSAWTA